DSHAIGARLLQQREDRCLRWRVGDWRQVACDFVHVDECAKRARARLMSGPLQHRVQNQGDDEHALWFVQMRDRDNRNARTSVWREEERSGLKRFTITPQL